MKLYQFNALLKVEEYWQCEIKIPDDLVDNVDGIRSYILDNPQEIAWINVRESYPGDILDIEEIENVED